MPGRSSMMIFLWPFRRPSFSTVTPGQFPTYWLAPVRALKSVVFPQLGLPARAMVILLMNGFLVLIYGCPSCCKVRKRAVIEAESMDMDVLRFRFANGEFVPADSNFNGISQRGDFADEYLRSLGNPMSMMRLLTGPSPPVCRR